MLFPYMPPPPSKNQVSDPANPLVHILGDSFALGVPGEVAMQVVEVRPLPFDPARMAFEQSFVAVDSGYPRELKLYIGDEGQNFIKCVLSAFFSFTLL
jgi:hypothetical protein